ncbi:DUF1173 family protein [Azospirillum sp. sgz302134]
MEGQYWVEFPDGTKISPQKRRDSPAAFRDALRKVHEGPPDTHATCLCPGRGAKKLYVARHGEEYRLARYPKSGLEHSPDCAFFATPAELSGLAGYSKGVVVEGNDGSKKIRLKIGLTAKPSKPKEDTEPEEPEKSETEDEGATRGASQTAMTELGLLQLLWTEAGINRWHPNMAGKRYWSVVGFHIAKAAERVRAGRTSLSSALVVVQPDRSDEYRAKAVDKAWNVIGPALAVRDTQKTIARLVVIGEVRALVQGFDTTTIALYDDRAYGMRLIMEPKPLARFLTRFPDVTAELQNRRPNVQPSARAIGIFLVEPRRTEDGMLGEVISMGMMLTTRTFIPFSSSYERRIAEQLFSEERYFEKPMRFDAAEDVVFPDFLLYDTDAQIVPMEVYGRDDAGYLARREKKRAIYPDLFPDAPCWEWLAAEQPDPPPFPPLRRAQRPPEAGGEGQPERREDGKAA